MSHFFAYLARMKFIRRWGLMRNTHPENIQEHSLQVSMIAHGLAVIGKYIFNKDIDPEKTAVFALYHDVGEVITGDIATPIKYFNPKIKSAYQEIERIARQKLLSMLPDELQEHYRMLFYEEESDRRYREVVKAADKICAYLKCIEELKAGNQEFAKAKTAISRQLRAIEMPEVAYFMKVYVPSFSLTLDELN